MKNETLSLAKTMVEILDSKKAENIKLLEIASLTTLADYFILANGRSTTQVKALAGEIEHKLKEQGITPHHIEGFGSGSWILLDYSAVVVHVFMPDSREFYALERSWADGISIDISDILLQQ